MTHTDPGPAPLTGGADPGPSRLPASRPTRAPRTPYAVLEALRLLVVVFFAGAGYSIGTSVQTDRPVLGALNGTAVGLVLGSGLGYVLGGVVGRKTAATAEVARTRLRDVSAEQLVAGALGMVGGVLLGAGVAWPVFFLPQAYLAFPLFAFVVVVLGYFGAVVAMSKREGVLALFGERAGLAPRSEATANRDRVVDTSAAVDGRVLDVVRAGFLAGRFLVPSPVLAELQGLADAGDDLRRSRGRKGLEVLEALKREDGVDVEVLDVDVPGVHEVDAKLVRICLDRDAALLTLDTNLAKAAGLAGVRVLNLHALSLAMRPPVAAGDDVPVLLLKAGKEPGQAVGYLDDGSMVVVEGGRRSLGSEVPVRVTSVLTTANGRLVFGRPDHGRRAPSAAAHRAAQPRRRPPALRVTGPAVVGALVPAAGAGLRLGPGAPKALRELAGEPLLVHAVRGLRAAPSVGPVVVAAPAADVEAVGALLAPYDVVVVAGGAERQDSVRLALAALDPAAELVLVHDAARCLVPVAVVEAVVEALRAGADAVVPVLPVVDTVKAGRRRPGRRHRRPGAAARGADAAGLPPRGAARPRTPPACPRPPTTPGWSRRCGGTVATVPGSEEAFKVTRPLDLLLAEAVLRAR